MSTETGKEVYLAAVDNDDEKMEELILKASKADIDWQNPEVSLLTWNDACFLCMYLKITIKVL